MNKDDKDDIELSETCWNKYEEFHKDKVIYFKKIYSIFSNYRTYLQDFQNHYNSLKLYELISQVVGDQFNDLMKYLDKTVKNFFDFNFVLINCILTEFSDINNNFKSVNSIYEKVVSEHKKYKDKKDKVERIKNSFLIKMGNIEDKLKEKIIQNEKKCLIDMKKFNLAMKDFTDYKTNLEDLNKIRETFNKDQKTLLELNYKQFIKNEAKSFDIIKKKFCFAQKNISDISSSILKNYNYTNKKESDSQKIENENKYFNNIIKRFKSREKPEEKIKLIEYYIRYKPYMNDSNNKIENITQANQINEEILKILKKAIKEHYQDSGLKIQEALYDLPDFYKIFFRRQSKLNKPLKNELLNLLKENNYLYHPILIELAKLRSDTKFFASKEHMEFVTEILFEILKIIHQKQDLNAVKNCILLSQTYYYIDANNKKIYSFEKLKKYKWIRTFKFWRKFLMYYINREFDKFEFEYELDVQLKDNPELTPKIKDKVKDVLFSSLIPYINNMNEIKLDKRIILKLLDEVTEKYKYLDESSIKNLEGFISQSQ